MQASVMAVEQRTVRGFGCPRRTPSCSRTSPSSRGRGGRAPVSRSSKWASVPPPTAEPGSPSSGPEMGWRSSFAADELPPSHATVADQVPRGVASHLEREVRRGGVVDRDCWVHGAPNVFVAGSAAFPISGFAGPPLTVIALALCVGDRIVGDGR